MTLLFNSNYKPCVQWNYQVSLFLCLIIPFFYVGKASATPAIFEVGEAVLPATTGNTFTSITFQTPFANGAPPNVFTQTTTDGDDPCRIRIRNVSNTGFDAVCLESSAEDGTHPGMTFSYIAVADGNVDVPLATGGGTVPFQSSCIDTTVSVYGPACNDCSGTSTFTPLTFAPAFTGSAPALLTELQTTNNLLDGGDPAFLDVAVQTGSVTAAGFLGAIEQMEAGLGPLGNTERLCYLATPVNTCQELDFSSFGGPATAVTFNAVVGQTDIDGYNGNNPSCNAGEGVTFTAGCFDSAPISVAGKRSRRGNNGGMLRSCLVNATEQRLTFDEDRVSDAERSHIDEQASAIAFSSAFTTPVTLNLAQVTRSGRHVVFSWQTSAETFHLGYHLWGQLNDEWIQLNKKLIVPAESTIDSIKNYRHRIRLDNHQQDIVRFGISAVDTSGYEEFFGSFSEGNEYGEEALNESVDWSATRQEHDRRMMDNGYLQINGRWKRANKKRLRKTNNSLYGLDQSVINASSVGGEINYVTGSQLIAVVPEWRDVSLDELSVSLNGVAVSRVVESDDDLLSADDLIYFYALKPKPYDAIYLANYSYQFRLDKKLVIDGGQYDGNPDRIDSPRYDIGRVKQTLTSQKAYSAVLANGDPWFDAQLFSNGAPASRQYYFELANEVERSQGLNIDFALFGSIEFSGTEPDHDVEIWVNGALQSREQFDGLIEHKFQLAVPEEKLVLGRNSIEVIATGNTGYRADIVLIDSIVVTKAASLRQPTARFLPLEDVPEQAKYSVEINANQGNFKLFSYSNSGSITEVSNAKLLGSNLEFSALPTISSRNSHEVTYSAGTLAQFHQITNLDLIASAPGADQATDLLVVAHPSFITDELRQYLQYKRDTGLQTELIDWLRIVEVFGFGNNTPSALDNFLDAHHDKTADESFNLLLVGGHTFDYLGVTNTDIINFIPTHYRPVGIFGHAPTDNVFADLDDDNLPDLNIGRWPVRSKQDLSTIINKSIAWQENIQQKQFQSALLLAQQKDSRSLDFAKQLDGRVALPLRLSGEFASIEKLYIQDSSDTNSANSVESTRELIAEQLDQGLELLSFAGHASPASWAFNSVVNTNFIQQLSNAGKPTMVLPLACYTTYYESTSINTLAHQWLFAGDKGAAAVQGASVLGDYSENAVFADRYLRQARSAISIGEAIRLAKREMASNNEMLHNWALLGDPTLNLR